MTDEMPRSRLIIVITFISLLGLALSCSPLAAEGELVRALQSQKDFQTNKEKQKTRANWLTLIKEFEDAALAQYEPKHASRARYLAADLSLSSWQKFKQQADLEKAEALARRSVRDCPRCTHAAAAQLISGGALVEMKQLDQADKQLMKVELNYPGSPQVSQARKLLAQIRGGPPPTPDSEKQNTSASGTERHDNAKTQTSPNKGKTEAPKQPKVNLPPIPKPRGDGQAQVYFLHLHDVGNYTTVTAYIDKITPYVYNLIPPSKDGGSFRVYADLKGAVIAPGTKIQLGDKTKLVRLAKMNQFKNDVVRVVVDMPQAHPYRPVFLDKPPRLVFHIAKQASDLPAQGAEAQPEPPEKIAAPKSPPKTTPGSKGPTESLARQLGLKVKTVVIDPGHGGKDGGAAKQGLREKEITLKLAKKLASTIEKRLGLTVHLTRSDDRFITLERRTKIAHDKKADLFISLHVNANDLPQVEGFETYVLNFATDRSAMAVAARENASSDKNVAELQDILHIIAKNTKIAESRAMAQALHKTTLTALNKKYKVRDLGVKEAPFYVLVGTEIPSILVEIGFLTNKNDSARLGQDAYLDLLAEGLTNGLESYVKSFK